jgi:hypothetical protein
LQSLLNQRPFLHPQPEDAPCLGARDPLLMATAYTVSKENVHSIVMIDNWLYVDTAYLLQNDS